MGKKKKKRKTKLRLLFLLGLGVLVVGLLYAVDAGRQVTGRMSGKIFSLPSRVYYSAPVLYPGMPFPPKVLKSYLDRLGYQSIEKGAVDTGQYRRWDDRIMIGLRAFHDPAGKNPARAVLVRYQDEEIRDIHAHSQGKENELFTLHLEPELLGEFFKSKREERTLVRLDDVPATLKEAVLSMEDHRFYSHWGISLHGTLRALWANLRGGGVSQGGSTLTQQLMKNFFLTHERTFSRKIREAIMTLVAEALYSKDQIFEAYLNEIYLGQRGSASVHGFGEASKFYFSKTLQETTLAEQALLVGLISSPGRYSPYRNIERAAERRNLVLRKLWAEKKISEAAYELARTEVVSPRGRVVGNETPAYFVDYVRRELNERFSDSELTEDGLEIFTNLDSNFQRAAESAIKKVIPSLEKRISKKREKIDSDEPFQVALVSMVPQTGAIKAWVGGRSYEKSQFNRVVQALRQPGSVVKPFVYAAALSTRKKNLPPVATASTILDDRATTFSHAGRDWSPKNYNEVYAGEVTVRSALERSLNVATINLASQVGLPRLTALFSDSGFQGVQALPSAVLGSIEVTPLMLARAYTMFANGGLRTEPLGISVVIDPKGHRLEQRTPKVKRVLSEDVAFLMTYLMQGVVDRGTAVSARKWGLIGDLAGKTGTTDDERDSWFVGFSPTLLTAVWVGFDDGSTVGLTGAGGALQIWIQYMKKVGQFLPKETFHPPKSIQFYKIDRKRGCVRAKGEKWLEAFLPGTEPAKCR